MANEIPPTIRLRSLRNVKPFTSVFDRPGVPIYTEEQFLGRGDQWREPVSPVGYGTPTPRPAPAIAAQYGLGSAREAAIRQAAMGGAAQRPQVQQRPAGFFDSLPSPMSPAGQALGAAAATGLQLSGWQDRPITLGQGLGAMAQAGMEAYTAARKDERANKLAEAKLYADALKAGMPKLETFYTDEGGTYKGFYQPNSPNADEFGIVKVGGIKPPSGTTMTVNPETGELMFSTGTGALQKPTMKTLEGDQLDLAELYNAVSASEALFDRQYLETGPRFAAMSTALAEKAGYEPSPEDLDFLQEYQGFMASASGTFSNILQQMSGVAVTKTELDRAKTFLPNVGTLNNPLSGDSPTAFQSKIRNQKSTILSAMYRNDLILKGGRITPDVARRYPIVATFKLKDPQGNPITKTMYMSEYVDEYSRKFGMSQAEAAEAWAEDVQELAYGK